MHALKWLLHQEKGHASPLRKAACIPELLEKGGSMIPVLSANSCIVRPAYPMTLLQELQAILEARSDSGLRPRPVASPAPTTSSPQAKKSSRPAVGSEPAPEAQEPGPSSTELASLAAADTNSIPTSEPAPPFDLSWDTRKRGRNPWRHLLQQRARASAPPSPR